MTTGDALLAYGVRIAPGLAVAAAVLALLPRDLGAVRACIHVMVFILVRDAMTPLGLWAIGTRPVFWLRLAPDATALVALGLASGLLVAGLLALEPELRRVIVWRRGGASAGVALGLAGAAAIAAPAILLALGTPVEARGGRVAAGLLPALAVLAFVGNMYEEVLFRGWIQGLLEERFGEARAVALSGLLFALGHIYLAATVTSAGPAVLVFTAYEGWIAAALRLRFGLVPAVIAHGGGIFLIAAGLP